MERNGIKAVCEATLMVAQEPVPLDRLQRLFADEEEVPERAELREILAELASDYDDRAVELTEVASGFRFQARSEMAPWLNRLTEERSPRYSRALLETLAIIAYRQPVTRGEIEAIRGVAVSTNIIRTLDERNWIRIAGHRDVPGRPAVFATTREFLDYFNLKSLADLPSLAELRDIEDPTVDMFAENSEALLAQAQGPADADAGEQAAGEDRASLEEPEHGDGTEADAGTADDAAPVPVTPADDEAPDGESLGNAASQSGDTGSPEAADDAEQPAVARQATG